ncbi:SLAM family member 5 isoform X2 [Cricetulus griseus]|uniref:SLAM family member 5 isoform X2 n=1 Tax=Cricetulus griseus TaxID=10029 RepID=A0A9J7H1I3_CRIGR|nr:SLAM family member 5 isoform X2 [Cricetulus griseus]
MYMQCPETCWLGLHIQLRHQNIPPEGKPSTDPKGERFILAVLGSRRPEAAGRHADLLVVNGILGESVTFPLNIQEPQKVKNIGWVSSFASSVAFVKPGLQGAPRDIFVIQATYEGRISVIDQNYDLVIRDLRMEDEGTYIANINVENTPTTTKRYNLHIYRRLGKAKITQSSITFLNNSCNVTLTCSVEKEEKNVTYSWSPLGERSNVLQIFQSPEDQNLTYTCTAQNPVSNSSDSVAAQQLCTDSPNFHLRRAVLSSGLAAALLLLILIPFFGFLLYLYKRWRNRIDLKGDVSRETTYRKMSRNDRLTESRIYDEIPECKVLSHKEESVNTIYSSVQLSEKMRKNDTSDGRPPKTLGNEIIV